MTLEQILQQLDAVAPKGEGFMTRCPVPTPVGAHTDGLHVRVKRCGHFDRVSPELWNRYLAAINAHDLEQWRLGGGAL